MCRLLRGGVDWNIRDNEDKLTDTVASFAEAWIEICSPGLIRLLSRRLLRGGVDWNQFCVPFANCWICRLLRGGVDWNHKHHHQQTCEMWVASFAEAWIEIGFVYYESQFETSPPSRRRGLKSWWNGCKYPRGISRLLRGGVDWNRKYRRLLPDYGMSLPSRRRGLKFCILLQAVSSLFRRLLRGGVDWNR